MPLPFSLVCDLLESSHRLSTARKGNNHVVSSWFARHHDRINAHDTDLAALLSTLLPDKRTDRVYCIQANTLEKIIGRALFLGASRIAELSRYRQPGLCIDLADCVSRLLTVTPNPSFNNTCQVTVEEIDSTLHALASRVKWSSPSIRASQATFTQGNRGDLEHLYRRLGAEEAKWLTRLILKNFEPLVFDPHLIYRLCDPILPSVLKIHDDFTAAITSAQSIKGTLLPNSASKATREQLLKSIKPQLGVKVGRQQWLKGRSIKHSLDMGQGQMSVEDKVDGEYCQIHVDLSKGDRCIQIFSKSGKDSTEDREALHGIIIDSLDIGKAGMRIKKGCILEGELVAYDDAQHAILPFHKIRKHVSRRGSYLSTEQDSLPGPHEHLMLIYYDILLLDDQSLIHARHSERFAILSNMISCREGWAELVHREIIDFNHNMGASNLRKAFARVILNRKEGLVLKPDDPYFDFSDMRRPYSSSCIKMKKEYIGNFGDVGDFAVVGARYDASKAKSYGIPGLKWTHFYLGCLDNREQVKRWNAKPEFTVVNVVELNEMMLRDVVFHSNTMPTPFNENDNLLLKLTPGVEQGTPMEVVFTRPLVFDMRCFSFDKVGNTGFWSLRFPSVTKVHFDRDFTDTVSFEQLQGMARDSTTVKELEDGQENLMWVAKLEAADPRGVAIDALSQLTVTTMPTPSPQKLSQPSAPSCTPTSPVAIMKPFGVLENTARNQLETSHPEATAGVLAPTVTLAEAQRHLGSARAASTKRRSLQAKSPPPCKRSKQMQPAEGAHTTQTHEQASSQTRLPLGNINGNPQVDPSTMSPVLTNSKELELEIVDLTSSPEASFTTTVTSKLRSSRTTHVSSPVDNATAITMPDSRDLQVRHDDRLEEIKQNNMSAKTLGREEATQYLSRDGCRFSGSACRLAKTVILIASGILEASEHLGSLLEDHGIYDAVLELPKWLDEDEARMSGDQHFEPGPNTILLVDSIERQAETKLLLEAVEERRQCIPEEERDLITVYDWRMLNNITIMEDKNAVHKYYDGWQDPWRQWYCGIV